MKTSIFTLSKKGYGVIAGTVLGSYLLTFGVVFAAVTPSVDTIIRNGSNTTVTSAPVGSNVQAYTTVSSSTGPTVLGTVDFSRYGNTTCSGTATVEAGVLLATGAVNSSTTTVPNTGLSYRVLYNGQTDVYATTTGPCVAVLPTSSGVTISSSLSSTTVYQGSTVYQTSTLSGATANATGTVSYGVYTNNVCNAGKVDAGVKNVTNAVVPQSNSIQFNTVGTLYWQAQYSGDQYNSSSNGPCQALAVLATTTPTPYPTPYPTPTPTPGTGSISGTAYGDSNTNFQKDSGEAGIAGMTIKLHGGMFWWWGNKNKMPTVQTTTTDANGNYTFPNLADGVYMVEQIKLNDWVQMSADYRWVLVTNGKVLTGLDFANATPSQYEAWKNGRRVEKEEKKENKKIEKEEKKAKQQAKKEENKQKQISKLLERIEKIKNR